MVLVQVISLHFCLGPDTNMLSYSVPNSGLLVPVKIKTEVSFFILINQQPIFDFRQDVILCSQPIDMDQHSIRNVNVRSIHYTQLIRPMLIA